MGPSGAGAGHAGRTFGEEEPYRLLEDVVSVSVGETECSALCADGTVWTWGARSGVSLEEHQDDPYYPPTQVLDQVVQLFGDLAVKEDGTLVRVWFDGDTCTAAPLMEHVAAVGQSVLRNSGPCHAGPGAGWQSLACALGE